MGGAIIVVFGLGWLIAVIGGIMFLVVAFKESVLWGLAVLFLPFASLIFLVKNWTEAKKPFLVQILGMLLFFSGFALVLSGGAVPAMGMMQCGNLPIPKELLEAQLEIATELGDMAVMEDVDEPQILYDQEEDGSFVGKELLAVKERLGHPPIILRAGGKTRYVYSDLKIEIVSEDGRTVAAQDILAD